MQSRFSRTCLAGLVLAAFGQTSFPWIPNGAEVDHATVFAQDARIPRASQGTAVLEAGSLVPAEELPIISPVESRLVSIEVREGTSVKQGDLLLQLDDANERARLNELQIELAGVDGVLTKVLSEQRFVDEQLQLAGTVAGARKRAAEAKKLAAQESLEAQGASELQRNATMADVELQLLEIELENRRMLRDLQRESTDSTVRRKQAELQKKLLVDRIEQSRKAVESCRVTAPRDGVFMLPVVNARRTNSITLEPGSMVREQQPLGRIVSADNLQMRVTVNETRIAQVKAGQSVQVTLDAVPELKITGKVISVGEVALPTSFLNTNRSDYEVIVKLDGVNQLLRPGMTGVAEIQVD